VSRVAAVVIREFGYRYLHYLNAPVGSQVTWPDRAQESCRRPWDGI